MSIKEAVREIYGDEKAEEVFACINKQVALSFRKIVDLVHSEDFKNEFFKYCELYPNDDPKMPALAANLQFCLGKLFIKGIVITSLSKFHKIENRESRLKACIVDLVSTLDNIDINNPLPNYEEEGEPGFASSYSNTNIPL